jgi:ParB-like chromosome segregation protein Spo0J
MSASEHLQPYQLKMFMQAHELMDVAAADTPKWDSLNVHQPMRERKLKESKERKLYDSIAESGVQKPVTLDTMSFNEDDPSDFEEVIRDGHHRVAAANDINPNMYIPVEYRPFRIE